MQHRAGASPTPTFPVFNTSNAMSAVFSKLRNSWAKNPSRSVPRADSPSMTD